MLWFQLLVQFHDEAVHFVHYYLRRPLIHFCFLGVVGAGTGVEIVVLFTLLLVLRELVSHKSLFVFFVPFVLPRTRRRIKIFCQILVEISRRFSELSRFGRHLLYIILDQIMAGAGRVNPLKRCLRAPIKFKARIRHLEF